MKKLDNRLKEFFDNKSDGIITFEETYVGNNKVCTCNFLISTETLASKMEAFSESIQNAISNKGV